MAKGDDVVVTVYGLYQQPVSTSNSWGFSLASFVASLLQQPAPTTPSGETTRRVRVLPLLSAGLTAATLPALTQLAGGVPKAYLRVLVFNRDSVLIDSPTHQLTAGAKGGYEQLHLAVSVPQAGYVQVYVANESDTDVFFDDITVEHRQGLQVQENHYDPFGLDLAGFSKSATPQNQYTFNGKEKQTDFGLNWLDYGFRMYDAQLAKFHTVDPLSDRLNQFSGYTYAANNPIKFIDLFGLAPVYSNGAYYEGNEQVGWGYVQSWLKDNNAISSSYRPLTKERLEQIAGPTTVGDGKRQADMGIRFEQVALESLGLNKYTGPPLPSPERARATKGVIGFIQPDVVDYVTVHDDSKGIWSFIIGERYEGAYTEIKATNKSSIPMSYDNYQIYGEIHNLASSPAALNGKRATLTLIGLANSYPGASLIKEASRNNVSLFMGWALERIDNGHGTGIINFTSLFQITQGGSRVSIPVIPGILNKDVKF